MLNTGKIGGPLPQIATYLRLLGEDGRTIDDAARCLARPVYEVRDLCRKHGASLSDYTPGAQVAKLAWEKIERFEYVLKLDGAEIGKASRFEVGQYRAWVSTDAGSTSVETKTLPSAMRALNKEIDRKSSALLGVHDVEIKGTP